MSEVEDTVMMTGNCKCENTISEFLTYSTFNCCHHYTLLLKRQFFTLMSKNSGAFS